MSFRKMPYRLLILAIGLIALSACSNESSNNQPATMTHVTELPAAVLTLPLGGDLRAYITIDGGTRIEMGITANTATTVIPGLSRDTHTVLVEFEYTDSSGITDTVATASTAVDLSSGDASISIAETDYDTDYDLDNDGLTNAEELAAGSWNDSGCVIGQSLIGSCTL